ncbi:MAG: SusC/RagA family TonB-linked outer membrane protein [Agriterribacter sp.]
MMIALRYTAMLCLTVCALISFAQAQTVTGTVMDNKGANLPGISVVIKGTSTGTVTAEDGTFTLNNVKAGAKLVFSGAGFASQEVSATPGTAMNIVLETTVANLNEVVVIGYGTARKKDLTGAVANVNSKDFNQGPVNNPVQQIAGKVSGVVITQPSGDPNQNISIRLRGQTSLTGNQAPLIVVDGVQLPDPNQISSISPADIVSYDVLKDASATAVYGARGANGVILIATKRGSAGRTQVDYTGMVGFDKNAKKYDLLNAKDFVAAGGTTDNFAGGATLRNGNTDWVDAITRTAPTTSHNIGISGGAGGFNYHGSLSYLNNQGIVINSGKEMYGLNLNAQQKALNNKLTINLGVNANRANRKWTDFSVFYYALQMAPIAPVHDSTGNYYAFRNDFDIYNPVPRQEMQLNRSIDQTNLWNGSIDYEIVDGLKLGVAGSMSYFNRQSDFYQPALPGYGNINNGNKYVENNDSKRGELHAYYVKTFNDKHNVNATAVYEYNYFATNNGRAAGENYLYDPNENNNLGGGNPARNSVSSFKDAYKLISFMGRVMYNYDTRYYLTASLRRDGSSKFGTNHQWGYFPSVAVAWRLTQEEFLKNTGWLNELKISAGWGRTGNSDAISPYQTLLLLGGSGTFYNPATPSFNYRTAYSPSQNANSDLKWETRQGMNFQVDFSIFNRITGNINVFNDKTKDLLYNYTVPTPPFFVSNIWANVGDLTNKGVEVQLNADIIKGKDVSWNLGGQISFVKTRVESLHGTYNGYDLNTDHIAAGYAQGRGLSNNPITYLQVGYSPYVFYLPHYVGLDSEGKQLFDDGKDGTVGKGDLNDDMKKYIDPAPKFTYGINNLVTYKKWALNFFLRGVSGNKYFNNTRMLIDNVQNLKNGNTTKTGLESGDKDDKVASDRWLVNASFIRLDNATLSYTVGKISDHFDNLRFFITGNNLFVITKYTGLDPEIQVTGTNNAYIDMYNADNAYYKSRSFSVGVNLSIK